MTEQHDDDWISGADSPEQAAALAAAATAVTSPSPNIEAPLDGPVKLPGGFRRLDGSGFREVREAWVRELNGEDEEIIVKAASKSATSLNTVVSMILERGVERLGDREASRDDLRNLLVGDRDYLLLEISRATYGNEIEYDDYECYHCRNKVSFAVRLDTDIPVIRLDKIEDQEFEVTLKRGQVARVRLPNGIDQEEMLVEGKTISESNSSVLGRILLTVDDDPVDDANYARHLPIPDRNKILAEVAKRMSGPRYNEITFTHEECGREIVVPFGLMSLFPGLV